MGTVTALDVAKLFLLKAGANGDVITNLKLQKLLYYAQAWYLVNFNEPLFPENIEAWEWGPVVPVVYQRYKKYKSEPIPLPGRFSRESVFTARQKAFVELILSRFNGFSATALVNMTHNEDPWKTNFEKGKNKIIPLDQMRAYYKGVYERIKKERES